MAPDAAASTKAQAQAEPPVRSVVAFFAITFAIAWGMLVAYATVPEGVREWIGPISGSHPLFILAVYAPAISALILVLKHAGVPGLRGFLSRLLLWRMPAIWWMVLLVLLPACFLAGAALGGGLRDWLPGLPGAGALLSVVAFMLVLGPVEELGWRGYALPLLQRVMAPLWAGLLVGVIWSVWHLPAFYLSGTVQSAWSFTPFFIGSVGAGMILTGLFNAGRGSILLAALFHFQLNNPLWPNAQPWDMYLFAGVSVVVVWFDRRRMLARPGSVDGGVTGVTTAGV